MKTNTMAIDIDNKNLEENLKLLIESVHKGEFKELLIAFYSFSTQQKVNDKRYSELEKLEGIIDLYNLLENTGKI